MTPSPAWFITWALLVASCCNLTTSVTVNDHTLYYQKHATDQDWVTVMHFLTQGTSHLTRNEWDAMSEGQISMALEEWADINKMISDFCSADNIDCNYKVAGDHSFKDAMNELFLRIQLVSRKNFQRIEIR